MHGRTSRPVTWIYDLPLWAFASCTVIVLCTAAALAHWVVLRYVPTVEFVKHNSVAGFVFSIVGTAFAVLLSFMVVIVWQQYNAADDTVASEANAVSDIHRICDALPQPTGSVVKEELDHYVDLMISVEWRRMRQGSWSRRAQELVKRITLQLATAIPKNPAQQNAQSLALEADRAMLDARRERLHDNETGIPWILWATLWVVAAITILFSFLFGMENVRIQLAMTVALTMTISVMFVLIAELDYPFRGDIAVSPHSWYQIQRMLHSNR